MAKKKRQTAIQVDPRELELALGDDGLLRGAPEPAIVLGAFLAMDGHAHLVGRSVARFAPRDSYPTSAKPTAPARLEARVPFYRGHLAILAIALEEDAARAAARVYAALAEPEQLWAWGEGAEPAPLSAAGRLGSGPVQLFAGRHELERQTIGDELIGVHLLVLGPNDPARDHRLRFLRAGNDWTLILHVAGS